MHIRFATIEDKDEILQLYKDAIGSEGCTWDEAYPGERELCNDISGTNIICMINDTKEIVAALSVDEDPAVDELDVWNKELAPAAEFARMVVRGDYRGKKIPERMIEFFLAVLEVRGYKSAHYLVSPHHKRALAAYKGTGFNKVGECHVYDKDWLCYEKRIRPDNTGERLLTGYFGKKIWRKFIKAVEEYRLIESGDRIAVCISGGKDSMLLALLLKMAAVHHVFDFTPEYIMLDSGYSKENLEKVMTNAEKIGINIHIYKENLFDNVEEIGGNPCFFCSRMRRGTLYRRAKELGCNKIALGHHYNDVVETILMGVVYGAQVQTMLPKLRSENVEGMELIRPLYLVREKDILDWQEMMEMKFVKCACRVAVSDGMEDTARLRVRRIIEELSKENDAVENNIFGSVMNVNLKKIMGYQKDGEHHDFLEDY